MESSEKKERVGVSEQIFSYIKDRIATGIWKPGDKIPSENELCKQMGVSRISVRAAISKLESLGILKGIRGKGTFVCETTAYMPLNDLYQPFLLSGDDRISMFEFRLAIEVSCAGYAAMRASTQDVDRMYKAIENMEHAASVAQISHYDMQFHYLIAKSTGNKAFIRCFEMLQASYANMFAQNVEMLGSLGAAAHHRIAAAIETRNIELARQEMEQHLRLTMSRTSTINQANPQINNRE